MGLAAAKETVSVPAIIYVERDGEELEVSIAVELELERDGSIGDWNVTSATAAGQDVKLGEDEVAEACEIAHEKYCANRSDYR